MFEKHFFKAVIYKSIMELYMQELQLETQITQKQRIIKEHSPVAAVFGFDFVRKCQAFLCFGMEEMKI